MTLALDRIATVAIHAIVGDGVGHDGETAAGIGNVALGDPEEVLGAVKEGTVMVLACVWQDRLSARIGGVPIVI